MNAISRNITFSRNINYRQISHCMRSHVKFSFHEIIMFDYFVIFFYGLIYIR